MGTLEPGYYVLWCLRRDGQMLEADLVSRDENSVLELFVNDRLTATARFPTRSRALECATRLRMWWERRGWVLLGMAELPAENDDVIH
jgi:hypothetical protein